MNIEVYSYSIFTTVLGMLVVFLSLSALSVMMVILKRIFSAEGKAGSVRRAEIAAAQKENDRKFEQPASTQQIPDWVPVAVAAYLAAEEEPDRPTADPWNAIVNQYDPWVSANRFSKRGV